MSEQRCPSRGLGTVLPGALTVVLVMALAVYRWSARSGEAPDLGLVVWIAVYLVLLALVVWYLLHRLSGHRRGRRVALSRRRSLALVEGWTDAGMRAVLHLSGRDPRVVHPAGGTSVTLLVTEEQVELWTGGRRPVLLLSVPWAQVAEVAATTGLVRDGERPGVLLRVVDGRRVLLMPAAEPEGGRGAADATQVRELARALDGVREVSVGPARSREAPS